MAEVPMTYWIQATWPMMSQCLPRLQPLHQRVSDPSEWNWHATVCQLKVSWVRSFAQILANSPLPCDCGSEIIFLLVMIVLGWMLFVGLSSYMGTFPEAMVSISPESLLGLDLSHTSIWDFWPRRKGFLTTNWKSTCNRNEASVFSSSHWAFFFGGISIPTSA